MRFESNPAVLISIVIPAFNEVENLPIVIADTLRELDLSPLAGRYELVMVNDGSSDGTREAADDLARVHRRVRVAHHNQNQGLGAAVHTGYQHSVGQYVCFIPADGEVKVDQVLALYAQLDGADLITSTRLGYDDGGDAYQRRAIHREIFTWGFTWMSRLLLGVNPKELTGIYIVRGDIVRAAPLHSQTGLLGIEIFMRCQKLKATRRRGTITICPRLSGQSKIANARGALKQFLDIFRLRRQLRHEQPIQLHRHSRAA